MTDDLKSPDALLFTHWETLDVRWGDMDAFAHVNHAAYFTYFETVRMNYFRLLDLDGFSKKGRFGPVLANASCNYRRQVRHPARLLVGARVSEIRNRSFAMEYVVLNIDDETVEIIADGATAVVWIETAAGKAVELPPALRKRITTVEEDRTPPVPFEQND